MKNQKHELKRAKARKLMTKLGGALSAEWEARKVAIAKRVKKQQGEAHKRALKRKADKKRFKGCKKGKVR